jgi:uncharacterized membrane protein
METAAPGWVLALAYWFHMAATVIWLGGLAAFSLIFLPAARKTLPAESFSKLLASGLQNLQRIGWMSLAILAATGMVQMSSSPFYKGILQINNPWAIAILAKHAVIGLMIIIGIYGTWGVEPAIQRVLIKSKLHPESAGEERLRLENQEARLMWINLGIGIVVLLLTAIARAM